MMGRMAWVMMSGGRGAFALLLWSRRAWVLRVGFRIEIYIVTIITHTHGVVAHIPPLNLAIHIRPHITHTHPLHLSISRRSSDSFPLKQEEPHPSNKTSCSKHFHTHTPTLNTIFSFLATRSAAASTSDNPPLGTGLHTALIKGTGFSGRRYWRI